MKTMHKRIISVILALCFCVLLIPNVSGAAVSGADAFVSEVREKMIARETEITFSLDITQATIEAEYGGNMDAFLNDFINELYAGVFAHDGTLKGGDYLQKHTGDRNLGMAYSYAGGVWHFDFTLTVEYYTTAAQEKELDKKLDGILKAADDEIGLFGLSDYKKIRWAYDYLCSRVRYDNEHLHDDDYLLKYSAYAALVNGTAVCQGYANLFYLMMQRLGVDARIITGWGDGEAHAWNIVKLGNLYYNCDSTWDVGAKTYRYFLRGSKTFENHKADPEFSDKTFTEVFPISETDYDINHKHKPAPMDPVAAACTEPGSEGGEYCIECGEILTQPTVVPALGHNFGRWIETLSPTCTAPGAEKGFCSRCPETETRPVDALGHDMNGRTEVIAAATVTGAGTLRTYCTRCDYYEDSEIPKLDPPDGPAQIKPGDVDGDGEVKTGDARTALRISIGLEPTLTTDTRAYKAADVDGKPGVSTNDARCILRAAIGLEELK